MMHANDRALVKSAADSFIWCWLRHAWSHSQMIFYHISMTTSRLEAFSDGVIAILITIMVLELRPPHDPSLGGLKPLIPVLLSYLLSFIFLGIYWTNHHHLLHAAEHVNGRVLWANLHLL